MSDVVMNPEAPGVSAAAPVAGRGNSLVLAAPPSPGYAVAVLAAALGRAEVGPASPILLIAPDAAFEAWGQAAGRAAAQAGRIAATGPFPSRAAHHLASGRVSLLVTTLPTASELLRRSALQLDRLAAIVVAWPELELSDEGFVPLFADLPKETQRIVVTADPAATTGFVERYAWKAPLLGPLGAPASAPAVPRLRVAPVRWNDRLQALGAIADLLDADQLAVWTTDGGSHPAIIERLAAHGVAAIPLAGAIPGDQPTVFFDAPPAELLGQAAFAKTIALVPPGTERFYGRAATRLEPVSLPGVLDQAAEAMLGDRRAIRVKLEAGLDRGAYATVAPLFERWSPAEVAVALQALWTDARTHRPSAPAAIPASRPAPHPKVWVNVGKKDGATLGEILALLNMDLGIPRQAMGKVELRDTFTLIEFSSEDEGRRAVDKLAGANFKGRRLAARVDRGRDRDKGRSA